MSTNFHVAGGSATLVVGDAVVAFWNAGAARWDVKRANAATLAVMPTPFGVVEVLHAGPPATADVLLAGELADNGVTGLNPGGALTANIVAVDPSAPTMATNLVRVERPNGSEFVTGTTDADGNLTIQPRASRDTSAQHVFNVCAYGAIGDGKTFVDAYVALGAPTTLRSPSGPFVASDVGASIVVVGAGAAGAPLSTTIATYVDAFSVTLSTGASTAVAGVAALVWTTDNTTAMNDATTAASAAGGTLLFPTGNYAVTSNITIPANVQVAFDEGAVLSPASVTVTIQGRVRCHPNQYVFGCTGAFALATTSFEHLTPLYWGARWDGVHDDSVCWDAMMDAIPLSDACRIALPLGLGYFSRDVHVRRYVHIEGRGGVDSLATSSGFKLAPLAKIVFDDAVSSSDGGNAATSYLGHFAIQAKAPAVGTQTEGLDYNILGITAGLGDVWTAGPVELGTLVVYSAATHGTPNATQPGSGPDVAFRCTTAGTAAGGEPMGFAGAGIADIGTTYFDGGGVGWTVESLPKDRQDNHSYSLGERMTNPGDARFIFECTTAGKSAASVPTTLNQPWFLDTIVDGNGVDPPVMWAVIPACNIFVRTSNVKIEHGQIRGGWGPAVHFESGPIAGGGQVYADFPRVDHLDVYHAGGGVHLHGDDVGGGQISNVNYNGTADIWRTTAGTAPGLGTGEICIWDRSESGNAMISNYAQGALAPGFVSDLADFIPPGQASRSGTLSNWYHNQSECHPTWLGGGSWLGTDAAGFAYVGGTVFAYNASQNIVCTDPSTADKLTSSLTRLDGHTVFSFSTAVEPGNGNFFAWSYNLPSAGYNTIFDWGDRGWFALGTNHANNATRCVAVSGMAAVQGAAHWREYLGKYVGVDDPSNPTKVLQYRGVSTAALTANVINGGYRNVGDKYAVDGTGVAGQWDEYVVSVAGYRGPAWTAGAAVTQGLAEVGVPASMVEPSLDGPIPLPGSQVFQCAGGPLMMGQAGGAASILSPPVATPYPGYSVTIDGVSGLTSADIGRFLVISGAAAPENNGAFLITAYDAMSGLAVIYNPVPVAPTTPDANNPAIAWQELDVIASGTGATEPINWASAVAVGDLVADNAGVTGVTWMLIGFTPTYALSQFIDDPVLQIEPRTRGVRQDTSATDAATSAPKCRTPWAVFQSETTTMTANQDIAIIDPVDPTWLPLTDNATHVVDVTITANGATEYGSCKLSTTYVRAGGGPTPVGGVDNTPKMQSGSTFRLFVVANTVHVQVSPGVNATVGYHVAVEIHERQA